MPRANFNIDKPLEEIKNKFRNLQINPVLDSGPVVQNLMVSIKKSDLWPNLECRPQDPDMTLEEIEEMIAAADGSVLDLPIEIAYGHNRIRAAQLMGIKDVEFHVQPHSVFTDDIYFTKYAYENKNDAKENQAVMIETVREGIEYVDNVLAPFKEESWEVYKNADNNWFEKKSQFDGWQREGIGSGILCRTVLEGWAASDVKNAIRVLDDIDSGFYTTETVAGMPSMGVLGQYSRLVEAVRQLEIPAFFKNRMVEGATDLINDPKFSTTVRIMKNAITAVKDTEKGINDPVNFIKTAKRSKSKFDVVSATRDLIFERPADLAEEFHIESVEALKDHPEFSGYGDLDQLMEDVTASIQKAEEAAAKAAAAEEAGEEVAAEEEVSGEELTEEGQSLIDSFQESLSAVELPDEADVTTDSAAVDAAADVCTQTLATATTQIGLLAGMADKLDEEDHAHLFTQMNDLVEAINAFQIAAGLSE